MTLKLIDIINLQPIYQKLKTQSFPAKTSYKLSKLFKGIGAESELYSEELTKLLNLYAEKDPEGKPKVIGDNEGIQIQQEYISKFQEELTSLWNLDVTLPDIRFSIDELEKAEFSVEEFNLFLPFMEE